MTIESGNRTLLYAALPAPTEDVWTHYDVQLTANAIGGIWLAFPTGAPAFTLASASDSQTVFANITRLSITGEFINDSLTPTPSGSIM